MPKNKTWISDARGEEGSFCDTHSGHQYDNVDGFTALEQARTAESQGDEVIWVDKSINGLGDESRPHDAIQPDDRYNVHLTEEDSQGVNTPRRYGPGR